ncbi:ABC transporter substrate-binding protein [Bradyrhizobium sp. dw_411]|uniref:ABC transporter substrate-binding protein n=1 Tax=Bradyrhizobium sp. dw_411 TaxID=2720082 RepID=UPI001BCC918F|nr:ABC transporter substrate-binding protein [Bradyrhizobium sp. dw_411]
MNFRQILPRMLIVLAASVGMLRTAPAAESVKIMMDWQFGGTHAPYVFAESRGYFKEAGIDATIDQGQGSTNVAVSVASGAYQFGLLDLPTLIKFNALNPETPLVAVYAAFDETPIVIVTPVSKGIKEPADLDGKKISGAPGNAAREIAGILLRHAHAEKAQINWMPIQGNLVGAMLAKGEVDGLGGQTTSQIPSAVQAGFKLSELRVIRYADYAPDLYGLAFAVTKKYAESKPEIVKAVVRALNRGTIDAIASPDQALAAFLARFPMMQEDTEAMRLKLAIGHALTANTRANGLSSVSIDRLQKNIDEVAATFQISNPPKVGDLYTDRFLPPKEERLPKAGG